MVSLIAVAFKSTVFDVAAMPANGSDMVKLAVNLKLSAVSEGTTNQRAAIDVTAAYGNNDVRKKRLTSSFLKNRSKITDFNGLIAVKRLFLSGLVIGRALQICAKWRQSAGSGSVDRFDRQPRGLGFDRSNR
jgi:hypothetical protein